MNCEHCKGPVDVTSHNGAKLRCGCGKTYVEVDKHAELESLIGVLRRNRVTQYQAGGVMLVLHPESWKVEPGVPDTVSTTAPPEASRICKCSHHLVSEHGEAGCHYGCSADLCASTFAEAA